MRRLGTGTEVEGGKQVALPNYTLKVARQVSMSGREWWVLLMQVKQDPSPL